jgi:hypothetical protein
MANYTIIGGDKQEYGPVTAEDIRQWIVEGRLDRNSLARSENDTEWRSLSAFPEFGVFFQTRPHSPPPLGAPSDHDRETALAAVKTPALCLIFSSILNIILTVLTLIQAIISPVDIDKQMAQATSFLQSLGLQVPKSTLNDPQMQSMMHMAGWATIVGQILGLVVSAMVLAGASRMLKLRNYEFAMVAAFAAVIPCLTPCLGYLLFLPFGIWALIVLRKPGMKNRFH